MRYGTSSTRPRHDDRDSPSGIGQDRPRATYCKGTDGKGTDRYGRFRCRKGMLMRCRGFSSSGLTTPARAIRRLLPLRYPARPFGLLPIFVRILALAVLLATPFQERADGCNFGDFVNEFENTVGSLSSGACGAACADSGACALSAGLAATLEGLGSVDQICNQLNSTVNLGSWLSALGVDPSAIINLGNPISIAQCGCDLAQGVGQIVGSLGACFQQALCGLQQAFFGQGCGCTPSPPQIVDCSSIYGENRYPPPSRVDQTPNGVLVTNLVDACQPQYCFCPSPMRLGEQQTPQDNGVWPCTHTNLPMDCTWTYSCQCPTSSDPTQNTHPAAPSGPLSQVCICDQTGRAAGPPVPGPYNPEGQICPPSFTGKTCPPGQVNYRNNCVPPCTSNEVRTPAGSCCDPTQVTSCGTCCPAGTQPNLTNGTCGPNQTTQ